MSFFTKLTQNKWLIACLILTFIVLSPNINNDFLNWDDQAYVVNNPLIKDFSLTGVKNIFLTKQVVGTYSPLVLLSWSVDYAIFGLNPTAFHVINLLLHLMIVAFVFYLSWLLSKRIEVAFITAILFGIHPMHVESVSWISARKDILYTLFLIGSMIAYYFYTEENTKYAKKYNYIVCLVLFLLSLLSKGVAVIFPLLLFLFDYIKNRKISLQIVIEKIPFFILSIVFFYIALNGQSDGQAMEERKFVSYIDSLFVGFYGYFTYLIKSVFPFNLSAYHPYPYRVGGNVPWYFYVSVLPVLALFFLTLIKAKKNRILGFSNAFFFISLIPVIQVLPFGTAITADRYTYLPYFGLFLLFGYGFVWLLDLYPKIKKPLLLGFSGYLFFLGIVAFQYCKTFKNTEVLWSNVIRHYPNDFLGYMNRTNYRISKSRFKEALDDAKKAVLLSPDNYLLYYNRAFANEVIGNHDLALYDYTKTIGLNKKYYSAYLNRGILRFKSKEYDKAIEDYTLAINLDSTNYKAYYNRAIGYKNAGQYNKAVQDLSQVIALDQLVLISLIARGEILLAMNQKVQALSDFNKVLELDPNEAHVYTKRGILYFDNKNYDLAQIDFKTAITLDKNQIEAHINLGIILMNKSNFKEALKNFNSAERLSPNNHLIYYNRGLLHQLTGNLKAALIDFEKCISINADFIPANQDKEKLEAQIQKG